MRILKKNANLQAGVQAESIREKLTTTMLLLYVKLLFRASD